MGTFKDGSKRFEIRHANDLKLAHPESLAAPVSRPALGRPSSSNSDDKLTVETPITNRFDNFPSKAAESEADSMVASKQAAGYCGTQPLAGHATSIPEESLPASELMNDRD